VPSSRSAAESAPALEVPRGHEELVRGLWRAARAQRLAHFLLLTGPAGAGKWLAVRRLAAGLLCAKGPGEPCGACGPCRRVAAGSHADLLVLDPLAAEVERIPVAWVNGAAGSGDEAPREWIESFLALKSAEGGWRIVLLREAERMAHGQNHAQNALLKTLEEPAPGTLLVLETSRPDRLLPTIHSRAHVLACAAPGARVTREVLAAHGHAGAHAELAARWSRGAPGVALELLARRAPESRAVLFEVLRGARRALDVQQELWELEIELRAGSERARDRERAAWLLGQAHGLLHDAWRAGNGAPLDALVHGDLGAALAAAWPARRAAHAERRLLELAQACVDIGSNLAPEQALERGLAALSE
jgi:DNA polymerase-3 subunit delta'